MEGRVIEPVAVVVQHAVGMADDFLAGEAIHIRVGQTAALGGRVAERIVTVAGHHRLAAVDQARDIPVAVRMIIRVAGPVAARVPTRPGQQPADAPRPFQAAGEIAAPRVAHRGRVAPVPFLDDPLAVVNIIRLGTQLPVRTAQQLHARSGLPRPLVSRRRFGPAAVVHIFQALAQAAQAVVSKDRLVVAPREVV